jgi:tetratricopeptide (TPR) repeat protein
MDGQQWPLVASVAALIDLHAIGIKELLQLGTFFGSLYGAWKWWRFSKWQIAKRLLEYLDHQEKNIVECREAVLNHLRYGKPLDLAAQQVHSSIEAALGEVSPEPSRAEQRLIDFAASLTEDAKVGTRYSDNASRQAATVLLFTGLIAKRKRNDTAAAKIAWTDGLQHNKEDPELVRCLAELEFEAQRDGEALKGLQASASLAPDNKRLRAETSEIRGRIYQRMGKPLLERTALHDAGDNFLAIDEYASAAKAYLRAAELELTPQLRMVNVAPNTLRKAYQGYFQATNRVAAEDVRQRLVRLEEDVSSLPTFAAQPAALFPWHWARLAGELLLLGAAISLFYGSFR